MKSTTTLPASTQTVSRRLAVRSIEPQHLVKRVIVGTSTRVVTSTDNDYCYKTYDPACVATESLMSTSYYVPTTTTTTTVTTNTQVLVQVTKQVTVTETKTETQDDVTVTRQAASTSSSSQQQATTTTRASTSATPVDQSLFSTSSTTRPPSASATPDPVSNGGSNITPITRTLGRAPRTIVWHYMQFLILYQIVSSYLFS